MTTEQLLLILAAVACALVLVNQYKGTKGIAGKLAAWAARRLYAGDPGRGALREEEWLTLGDDRSALAFLGTALVLAGYSLISNVAARLAASPARRRDTGTESTAAELTARIPPTAAIFEQVGVVQASQLTEPLAWTTQTGERMHGLAGDWRIIDAAGNLWTLTDQDFQSTHEPIGGGRWRKVGKCRAWQVSEEIVVETKQGSAVARPGDWVVEKDDGIRSPIRDDEFRWNYRPSREAPLVSSAAPTISS